MANLETILEKIKTHLPADAGEAIALVAEATREAKNLQADLSSANAESKSRKEKLRDLAAEKEMLQEQIDKLSAGDGELKRLRSIEQDHNKLITEQKAQIRSQWIDTSKVLQCKKGDPLFDRAEKVKSLFVLKDNPDDYTDDEITANLEAWKPLATAEYFKPEPKHTNPAYPPASPPTDNGAPEVSPYVAKLKST